MVLHFVIPHFLTVYFLFTRHLSSFHRIVFSNFYILFHGILSVFFSTFYISISQHFILTLYRHFTRLVSNFYPLKSHFLSIRFTNVSPLLSLFFTSVLNTEKSRRLRRNFGIEVTLKYLIWFRRDIFYLFYLLVIILFYLVYFLPFILPFLFYSYFIFSFLFILLLILFVCYFLVQFRSTFSPGPYTSPAQGHFRPDFFLSHNLVGHYL